HDAHQHDERPERLLGGRQTRHDGLWRRGLGRRRWCGRLLLRAEGPAIATGLAPAEATRVDERLTAAGTASTGRARAVLGWGDDRGHGSAASQPNSSRTG